MPVFEPSEFEPEIATNESRSGKFVIQSVEIRPPTDPKQEIDEILKRVSRLRELSQLDEDQKLSLAVIEQQAKIFMRPFEAPQAQTISEQPPLESVLPKRQPFKRSGQHRNYKISNHGIMNDDEQLEKRRGIESERQNALAGKENRKNQKEAVTVLKRVIKQEPKSPKLPKKRARLEPTSSAPIRLARASKSKAKLTLVELY